MTAISAKQQTGEVTRTASGAYVLSRSLADPEMKPALDAYVKKVTRSPAAAQEFLRRVGILTRAGNLARSYGG